MADFYATSNGVKTANRMVASANIGDNMLIVYQDLLKFNAIHVIFPYEVLTYSVKAKVLAKNQEGSQRCPKSHSHEDSKPNPNYS